MKKAVWVGVAIAIAVAGTWGYGALARREDDSGRPVRLLAIAEEQSLGGVADRAPGLQRRGLTSGRPIGPARAWRCRLDTLVVHCLQ